MPTDPNALTKAQARRNYTSLMAEQLTRPPVVRLFGPSATEVAIERVSSTLHYLYQNLGNQRWWRQEIRTADTLSAATPGSGNCPMLDGSLIGRPMLSNSLQSSSNVRTGTWVGGAGSSNASAYNGQYDQSSTTGDTVTLTLPAFGTAVGIRAPVATNGGLAKVSIDGSLTAANLLKTAQQVVDDGNFPNTILVANGGTLNPTDRVIDFYSPVSGANSIWDQRWIFADELVPLTGTRTVVLTVTGYKRSASTGTRLYFSAFDYALSTTTLDTSGATLSPLKILLGTPPNGRISPDTVTSVPVNSEWVHAMSLQVSGGTTAFIGGYHGYEYAGTLAFTVDGVATALTNGQRVKGSKVVVTRTTTLRHPDNTGSDIGSSTTIYTVTSDGLRVQDTVTWTGANLVATLAYPAMFPTLNQSIRKGRIDTLGTLLAMTAHDGAYKGGAKGRAITMWDDRGYAAVCLYVPDPITSTNSWANSFNNFTPTQSHLHVQDTTTALSKAYLTRVGQGNPETLTPGTVWTSDTYRKVAWFPLGADTVLAAAA